MKKLVFAALAVVTLVAGAAHAQEQYVELLRQDLRTEKTAIVTESMMLTPEQGEVFWPIYREYETEVAKIWDARIALIKRYAESYETLDDATADEIATSAMDLSMKRLKLREKYYGKLKKELGGVLAARFSQVDGLIENLVYVQVSGEMPLATMGAGTQQER